MIIYRIQSQSAYAAVMLVHLTEHYFPALVGTVDNEHAEFLVSEVQAREVVDYITEKCVDYDYASMTHVAHANARFLKELMDITR